MLAGFVTRTCLAIAVTIATLAACSSPPRLTTGATPPDPPPVPRRKPVFQATAAAAGVSVQEVALPQGPQTHAVVSGDTVFRIARAYGVPIRTVIDSNRLVPPYHLRPGQRLSIPALRVHVVARGDTVYGISRRYQLDMTELVSLNEIAPPFTISLGQQLVLPNPVVRRAPETLQAARPAAPERTADGVVIPPRKPKTERKGTAATTAQAPKPPPPVQKRGPIPDPPPRASGRFLWPVEGSVTLGFGPKQGGLHNDGINIAAPMGAPIVAAENGVVAYAGNELRGFGNLLLIKHAEGWVTAYAHAETLLVGRGATVKRGQTIARVGSSGSVSSPQLHFEIRKGADTVDPLRHLARRAAASAG